MVSLRARAAPSLRPRPLAPTRPRDASATSRSTRRRTSGSRTTPFGASAAAGLELRLHEHERLPAGRRERERRRQRRSAREMNETSQVTSCGANGSSVEDARVRPLEHGDARVVAQPLVQLPVADVERDHAPRAALEQDVGEAAGRRADVEAVEPAPGRRRTRRARSRACARRARRTAAAARPRAARASSTCSPGFECPGTSPAITSACACARALGQAALDEEDVEALLGHDGRAAASPATISLSTDVSASIRRGAPAPARAASSARRARLVLAHLEHVAVAVEDVVDDLEEQAELAGERAPRRMLGRRSARRPERRT